MSAIEFLSNFEDEIATELGTFLMTQMSTLGETPNAGQLNKFAKDLSDKIDAIYSSYNPRTADGKNYPNAIVIHTSATASENWDPTKHSISVIADELGNSGKMRVVYPGFSPNWHTNKMDNARELGMYFLKKCR